MARQVLRSSWIGVVALGLTLPSLLRAAEARVAVAANFMQPMNKLAAAFERETGHRVLPSFGSTGRLYAQVRNGAPFEVFLSADDETPRRLEHEGLAVAGTRMTYAVGRLVLWSLQPERVDARGEVLRRAGAERLAIADPKVAPYGRAAVQALTQLGLLSQWQPRFVQGESLGQVHQFVASGNAPLGLLAMAQVFEGGRLVQGSAWVVPEQLHDPIRQDAVLLVRGQGNVAAQAFMHYLRTDAARALIRSHGYRN